MWHFRFANSADTGGWENNVSSTTETAFTCDRTRRLTAVFPHWLLLAVIERMREATGISTAMRMHMRLRKRHRLSGVPACPGSFVFWNIAC